LLRNDEGAVRKAKELDEKGSSATTEINVFELTYGVYRSRHANRRLRLEQAGRLFSRLITLPLNHDAALKAGETLGKLTREGREASALDGLVASIAVVHGCDAIVTRNVKHFEMLGIRVETY